ncbi:hypothetical protein OHC33_007402 [Knufia fluminis]|uniref:Uncharacterized protein n=1 Tax=Knufia fluminis TaxID=191047 RepID=A0AAN8EC59_9EURO|nr:hypothetical protein OHC33_007402 [Knufia fluminis]
MPTTTAFPYPPPPPPDDDSDDEGEVSDDESELSDDDHDEEDHHKPGTRSPLSATPTAATASSPTSSIASSTTQTTLLTSTLPLVTATASTDTPASARTSEISLSQSDSTPVTEADSRLESKASSSPLGTAGIVLAAVFGFVALATTFYLLFRLVRRRKAYQTYQGGSSGRSDTFSSETSIEKGLPAWLSPTQDTGIVFGRRSRSRGSLSHAQQAQAQPRGRGRFSFLNRRWYSTGSEVTAAQATRSEAPSTPPRWGAPLFGLGVQHSRATTSRLASPTTSNEHHIPRQTELQRNLSQSSTGSGHARAYAHHNVRAPARSTISSISSRWLKRRSDSNRSEAVSETSDMYKTPPRRSTVSSEASTERRRSREGNQMPRLPLPVAVSGGARTMSV